MCFRKKCQADLTFLSIQILESQKRQTCRLQQEAKRTRDWSTFSHSLWPLTIQSIINGCRINQVIVGCACAPGGRFLECSAIIGKPSYSRRSTRKLNISLLTYKKHFFSYIDRRVSVKTALKYTKFNLETF